jgi:uncharacterized protein with gpF-like domain
MQGLTVSSASILNASFHKPFPEQVEFFRNKMKDLVPTDFWDDLKKNQHDRSFMVAGAKKSDLLSDLANAVDRHIAEGKGLGSFRKEFKSIVAKNGWTGWTGEDTKAGQA